MSEVDWERRIKEALKPVMAEYEKRIAEALKPVVAEHEERIRESLVQVDEVGRIRKKLKEEYGVEQRLPPRGTGLTLGTARMGSARGRGRPLTEEERAERHKALNPKEADPPEVEEEEYERVRERAKYVRGPTLV